MSTHAFALTSPPDTCNGKSDGTCDTNVIVSHANSQTNPTVSPTLYASGLCQATIEGYSDWYLPAICEMGYYRPAPSTPTITNGCGTEGSPLQQNRLSNLHDMGFGHLLGIIWSSTEYSTDDGSYNNAWSQYYLGRKVTYQTHDGKEDLNHVRCVRAITQP